MSEQEKHYIAALDVGTSKIIALIGEIDENDLQIVGWSEVESHGLKAGMVTNIDATAQAISQAMDEAQRMAGVQVGVVTTGISGNHIRSLNSQGVVKIRDGEVSRTDIERATDTAKAVNIPPDHEILHTVVQEYIIDSQPGVREPIGMSGVRLDTRVHLITGAVTALQNIQKCIERCGLEVGNIVLQPLASADAVLTEDEKELGVCVIDIGGGTTDIAVYTNGAIRHTAVIPIAGDLITRDLAQALRTPYHAAERIKIYHGVALSDIEGLDDEMIKVPSVGDRQERQILRSTLAYVIEARVEEILKLTLNELRRAGFTEDMFASGIVLTGGASLLPGIVELTEDIFRLPARVGVPPVLQGVAERIRNPRYSTVIGLLYAARAEALENAHRAPVQRNKAENRRAARPAASENTGPGIIERMKNWIANNL